MFNFEIKNHKKENIISMNQMQPLDIGIIIHCPDDENVGHYVMRTASEDKIEVIDLSELGVDNCWTALGNWEGSGNKVKVRILENCKLTLEHD